MKRWKDLKIEGLKDWRIWIKDLGFGIYERWKDETIQKLQNSQKSLKTIFWWLKKYTFWSRDSSGRKKVCFFVSRAVAEVKNYEFLFKKLSRKPSWIVFSFPSVRGRKKVYFSTSKAVAWWKSCVFRAGKCPFLCFTFLLKVSFLLFFNAIGSEGGDFASQGYFLLLKIQAKPKRKPRNPSNPDSMESRFFIGMEG